MSIFETEVTDVITLIAAARRTLDDFGKYPYWFRGHACAEWHLVPGVHRHYDSYGEQNLTQRFRLGAPTRHAKCPSTDDVGGWLALMQHFGLPTRLLDWTGSLLAATYFAVSHESFPRPAVVWALSPEHLNRAFGRMENQTYLMQSREARDLLLPAFIRTELKDDVMPVLPVDLDLRMTVQLGCFSIHTTKQPLEERAGAEKYLVKFIIPASAKKAFDDELWVLGIRRSALFPDLTNLAKELSSDQRVIPRLGDVV